MKVDKMINLIKDQVFQSRIVLNKNLIMTKKMIAMKIKISVKTEKLMKVVAKMNNINEKKIEKNVLLFNNKCFLYTFKLN